MLVNLSVTAMQVIMSFVIPMFLILLVIVSQLNIFVNLLTGTGNVLVNNLLIRIAVVNMALQNHLVP